jgi:uncharacterized protein (DUF2236 family)
MLRITAPVEKTLRNWVVGVLQKGGGADINYDTPLGDAGLFGPHSITWRIHADFPGMMAGGVSALMLQTLHPLALAGVWDHSNFRQDLLGRLRRTTAFVAATSFAPKAEAQKLIQRVKTIHRKVHGAAEDGTPYDANDPALLTWVHVTEMSSFLAGYLRYCNPKLSLAKQDAYYAETSQLAYALGAVSVPRSVAEVSAYFHSVQPQLAYGPRSAEVLKILWKIRLPIPFAGASRHLFLGAGAALLPDWAQAKIPSSRVQNLRDEAAARSLQLSGPLFRAALRDGVAARACRRVGVQYQTLRAC